MKTQCRIVLTCLAVALFCLAGHPAQGQTTFSPLLGPTLNYTLVTPPPSGTELIDLRLTGFVFSPTDLASLTQSQIAHYTIVSIGETGFESQGGVVSFAYGITRSSTPTANDGDEDWTYTADFTVKAHPAPPPVTGAPAIPEDPLPPSDPRQPLDFLVESTTTGSNGAPLHLYNQPFTLTNEDGSTEVITPGPYAAAPAVPEPSSLALLGVGLLGMLGLAARRRA